jgi:orotidine-5'-phosphate decarboxylase
MNRPEICLALDVDDPKQALDLVKNLGGTVDLFKIGLQLYCEQGNSFVSSIKTLGATVFLDLKFFDIPNTVANACKSVTRLGVDIINVHALGGSEMLQASIDAVNNEADRLGIKAPKLLGVTILTSINTQILKQEMGISGAAEENAVRLAELCKKVGLDGVVASPIETPKIRKACGDNFIIATPGIRPAQSDKNDQKRIATPREAATNGANILVIGRPIYGAANPKDAAEAIIKEL